MTCRIWHTPAAIEPKVGDYEIINSPRAGGRYRVSGSTAATDALNISPAEKARLTTWLVDQHRVGVETPIIEQSAIIVAKQRRPMSFSMKVNRFLELFWQKSGRIGETIRIFQNDTPGYGQKDRAEFCAWSELIDDRELSAFINILMEQGLFTSYNLNKNGILQLRQEGYARLEHIQSHPSISNQAFVAMWFDTSMDDAFDHGIMPAIEDCGYNAMRINNKEHINNVCDEIVAEIRKSYFIVADFTCGYLENDGKRIYISSGGVYFEAGFAQGLNIPVIWTCQADCMDGVHFDTQQYAHIVWKEPSDLRLALKRRIEAVIGLSATNTTA